MHGVLKDDLAGDRLPSGLFGANAAWWAIAVLTFNPVSEYGAGSELRHEAAGVGRTVGEQATESSPFHPDRPSGPGHTTRSKADDPPGPGTPLIRDAAQSAAEAIGAGCRAVRSIGELGWEHRLKATKGVAGPDHAFFVLKRATIWHGALQYPQNRRPKPSLRSKSEHM